jgi:hypothetical protein
MQLLLMTILLLLLLTSVSGSDDSIEIFFIPLGCEVDFPLNIFFARSIDLRFG